MTNKTATPDPHVPQLRRAVELMVGFTPASPAQFALLSHQIERATEEQVSQSTLMRMWNYIRSTTQPGRHTLNALARFVGYTDYNRFVINDDGHDPASATMLGRHINATTDLQPGDCLRLSWSPGRVCDVRYLGNRRFVVIESKATRLRAGDTFDCNLILNGEPLYIDNLRQGNNAPATYVCGLRGGIRFTTIECNV